MNTLNEKSLKSASIFALIYFSLALVENLIEKDFTQGVLNGIAGGSFFWVITFLISKSIIKNQITFKWWQ